MTTDLDDRIRTALRERAAEVSPRRTVPRAAGERTAHRWGAPLLAAAAVVVLAVAVAVAVTVHRGSGSDTGGTAAGAPPYAGYQWRVTSVQDHVGTLSVPPDLDATVAFTSSGAVSANDTVNALSGTYVARTSTYSVTNAGSTLAGFAGGDPDRERIIAAVDALFFTVSAAVPDDGSSPPVTISATVRGDLLTLQTVGTEVITVTLDRQGPVPSALTMAPSETPSAPSGAPSDVSGSAVSDLPYSGSASP